MSDSDPAIWSAVDDYIVDLLVPSDAVLDEVLAASAAAGLPEIQVSPNQAKFLQLLAGMQGARRILELGTLGGYSAICLARALPPGGRLVTLESERLHAEVARANFVYAGLADRVDLRLAPALASLRDLVNEQGRGAPPFDLIFLDADKESYPLYLPWLLQLSRPGTAIVADNVVRRGAVTDPTCADPRVQAVRRFYELVKAEPRLTATALQTVGSKGYDGLILAIVR